MDFSLGERIHVSTHGSEPWTAPPRRGNTYWGLFSLPGVWAFSGSMLEKDELKEAAPAPPPAVCASRTDSLRPGEYTKTNSLMAEKSVLRGMWDKID